jgi:hypothetical protein
MINVTEGEKKHLIYKIRRSKYSEIMLYIDAHNANLRRNSAKFDVLLFVALSYHETDNLLISASAGAE